MTLHYLSPRRKSETSDLPVLRGFQQEIDSLFDNLFSGRNELLVNKQGALTPRVDISETEKEFLISVEVPGVEEKDIDIELNAGVLTLRGEKKNEKQEEGRNFYRVERSYGSFQRSFSLPETIEEEGIKAVYGNGVLHLHLPKAEKTKDSSKKIRITKE